MATTPKTVTVTIGGEGHQVVITADVRRPADLVSLAERTYNNTRPAPRATVGFGSQLSQIGGDRQVGGDPIYHYTNTPVEATNDRP